MGPVLALEHVSEVLSENLWLTLLERAHNYFYLMVPRSNPFVWREVVALFDYLKDLKDVLAFIDCLDLKETDALESQDFMTFLLIVLGNGENSSRWSVISHGPYKIGGRVFTDSESSRVSNIQVQLWVVVYALAIEIYEVALLGERGIS